MHACVRARWCLIRFATGAGRCVIIRPWQIRYARTTDGVRIAHTRSGSGPPVLDCNFTSAGVRFEDRGEHALKGVADAQRVYAVRKDGA
jgi:hypothetical protein